MKENSIEEDIKNLEEIIDLSKEEIEAKDENTTAILNIIDLISLKNILSDYKRVLKENEEVRVSNKKLYEIDQEMYKQDKYTSENYISKQKIKDKIEEIQEEGYWLFTTDRDSDKCVEVLQQLLEGRK